MTSHQRRIRPPINLDERRARKEEAKAARKAAPNYYQVKKYEGLRYDYGQIAEEHREQVRAAAVDIRQRLKRTVEDMIEIGNRLNEVNGLFEESPQFYAWAQTEFGMSRGSVFEFGEIAFRAQRFHSNFEQMLPSVVRRLALPSVPDAAIEAVTAATVAAQKRLTYQAAMAIAKPLIPAKLPTAREKSRSNFEQNEPAIDASYTVVTDTYAFAGKGIVERSPDPNSVDVRMSRELAAKLCDGVVHRIFRTFLSGDEMDSLLIALTNALGKGVSE